MNPIIRNILLSNVNKKRLAIWHKAGTLDFSITNGRNVRWIFPDGSVSYASHPTVVVPAGRTWLYASNLGESGVQLTDGNSNAIVVGKLSDFKLLRYYLSLYNCNLITGSLADLQGKLTYLLDLTNCNLITGDLVDLQGKLTYYLSLYNCNLVTGVYTPVGAGTPTITNLSYTGLSIADMDNTLIAYAAATKNGGTFTANGMSRSANSNDAVAALTSPERGWTISGITLV